MSKKILITGAVGFIGSHLIEAILKETDWSIVCLDRLDTSGNLNRITDTDVWQTEKHRVKFYHHDLRAELNDGVAHLILMADSTEVKGGLKMPKPFDYVVHMAAGTHVDRSITDPLGFVYDNIVATANLLDFFRKYGDLALNPDGRILYFGTDEVFGPAPKDILYKEWDRHNPNNPYAATKSAAEELCIAWSHTFKLPIVITHCMNVFGERQHPEKFVPMTIKRVLSGDKVVIHSDKTKTKSGTRFYLHARNVCSATLYVLQHGQLLNGSGTQGKYNIVGDKEVSNLEMAQAIAKVLGKELNYEMVDFHSSRPGHDLRYGLDGSLLRDLGWVPPVDYETSLRRMIEWTVAHKDKWLY